MQFKNTHSVLWRGFRHTPLADRPGGLWHVWCWVYGMVTLSYYDGRYHRAGNSVIGMPLMMAPTCVLSAQAFIRHRLPLTSYSFNAR